MVCGGWMELGGGDDRVIQGDTPIRSQGKPTEKSENCEK